MKFRKEGDWKISECGFYRIQSVGWQKGRSSTFRLQVQLDDGWVDYPEAFKLYRQAKEMALFLEE